MTVNGNVQAFILAVIAFVGFFAYIMVVTIIKSTPDASIFPAIVGVVTGAGSFFFSGHIANGAAGKALDALVQTGKDRETAVAVATEATNGNVQHIETVAEQRARLQAEIDALPKP